jgi:hypothetical protein
MSELASCPFCGGPAKTPIKYDGSLQTGCAGDFKDCAGADVLAPIAYWNTRTPDWQDISTAPRDGTEIIVLIRPKVIRLGWWFHPSSRTKDWHDENGNVIHPTHWMPLPAPPKEVG